MNKSTQLLTCTLLSLLITGCSSTNYFQRDLAIEDSTAGLVEFSAEYKNGKRFGIRASFDQLRINDSDKLTTRTRLSSSDQEITDIAVVRQGDNYWEYPSTVNLNLKNNHVSIEGFYLPLDKKHFRLEVGGGFNHLTSELSVGSNPSSSADFSNTGFKVFTEGSFIINPQVSISVGVDATIYQGRNDHDQALESLIKVGVNWFPIDALTLSLGIFNSTLDGFRSDYDVNTGFVDPNSSLDDTCLRYLSSKSAGRSCLKEVDYFDNEMKIKGQGIVGGITLRF